MQEYVYYGEDHPLKGQVKEVKEHPDVVPTASPLTEIDILNIKLNAIAAKLYVDLDAAVAAAKVSP